MLATLLRWNAADRAGAPLLDADEPIYLNTGVNAARLGVLGAEPAIPSPERMPAVPSWVALSQFGIGSVDPIRTRHLQALVGGIGVFIFFLLGAVLDKERGSVVGLVAAALYAVHPDLISDTAVLRTEWLDVLLSASVALFAALWLRGPTPKGALFFGLALGAALLSRSFLFLLVPIALLARVPRRREWIPLLLLGVLIPLLPWIARNAVQFQSFIPFERGAAEPSLYYSSLGLPGSKGLAAYEAMAIEAHPELAALDSVARKYQMAVLARRNIIEEPARFFIASLKRFPVIWSQHLWLLLFAFIGFCLARKRVEAKVLAGLWAYYNLHIFVDVHLLRLHPSLAPLIGLCALGALEIPGMIRRIPPSPTRIRVHRWGLASVCILIFPALLFIARESFSVSPSPLPEPKIFLDRVVLAAQSGRLPEALALLDAKANAYPSFAALHLSHAALLERAGRSDEACASLARAAHIVEPLGSASGELGTRISTSLSTCN